MNDSDALLSVRGLRKTYATGLFKKRFEAIPDLSLEVGRGRVFGLLGPNGAGKTTLVKVLLGLVRFDRGDVRVFGSAPRNPATRRRVGYLPEAHRLPGYLTGRQVLQLFAQLCGRERKWVKPRIDGWLEKVGMREGADRKVREYSKGMQQRIGLAQALIHEPDLIFLDEPTDGVDPVGRKAIREVIDALRQQDVTVFINSHLLLEVERMCDRAVILHKGKILREGSIEELTPSSATARFVVDPLPENLDQILGASPSRIDANAFEVTASDSEVDDIIDRLRAARVGIRGLTRSRATLEDSFIDLIGKDRS